MLWDLMVLQALLPIHFIVSAFSLKINRISEKIEDFANILSPADTWPSVLPGKNTGGPRARPMMDAQPVTRAAIRSRAYFMAS